MFTFTFVFIVILCAGVLAKSTFLLMTTHTQNDSRVKYCNIRCEITYNGFFAVNKLIAKHFLDPYRELYAIVPHEQRIAWIWAVVFAFSLPELGTIFRAARICFFRNVSKPTSVQFGLVLMFETFHVIGLAIFTFLILPDFDVVKGLMLTNCVCIVPAILST